MELFEFRSILKEFGYTEFQIGLLWGSIRRKALSEGRSMDELTPQKVRSIAGLGFNQALPRTPPRRH